MKNMIKNEYIDYAKTELEYNGMIHTAVGKNMLDLIQSTYDLAEGNKFMMRHIVNMLDRLDKQLPLLPLEEDGMIPIPHLNGPDQMQHSRYRSVYQGKDGKYYDDKAVAFVADDGSFTYFHGNGIYNSNIEIQFPYYPEPKYIYISDENLNEQFSKAMAS